MSSLTCYRKYPIVWHYRTVKLSQWAKEQGLTYKGAWRMWKAGQLPVPAEQLPTGTIIVKQIKAPAPAVGLYARVASR